LWNKVSIHYYSWTYCSCWKIATDSSSAKRYLIRLDLAWRFIVDGYEWLFQVVTGRFCARSQNRSRSFQVRICFTTNRTIDFWTPFTMLKPYFFPQRASCEQSTPSGALNRYKTKKQKQMNSLEGWLYKKKTSSTNVSSITSLTYRGQAQQRWFWVKEVQVYLMKYLCISVTRFMTCELCLSVVWFVGLLLQE